MTKINNCSSKLRGFFLFSDTLNKAPINLKATYRKLIKIAEGGITCPKIINTDLPPESTVTGRLLEIEALEENNLKDGMVFSRKPEIQRFIDQIYSSPDWLYDIEVKAKEFGNPVWYQVYKDAEFMNNESRQMALAYVSQAN